MSNTRRVACVYQIMALLASLSLTQPSQEFCRDFIDLKRRGINVHTACPFNNKTRTRTPDELICCAHWATPQAHAKKARNFTLTDNHGPMRRSPDETTVDIEGIPWSLKTYCCNEDEDCCGGKCCPREETCCKDLHGNVTVTCCAAGCCKNSRGEVACCPEFTRRIVSFFVVVMFLYVVVGLVRAVKVYCNIRPVYLDDFKVLEEKRVKEMRYLIC